MNPSLLRHRLMRITAHSGRDDQTSQAVPHPLLRLLCGVRTIHSNDERDLGAILAAAVAAHGRDGQDLEAILVAMAAANGILLTMNQAAEILLLEKIWGLPGDEGQVRFLPSAITSRLTICRFVVLSWAGVRVVGVLIFDRLFGFIGIVG